jgi:hypothetical protein
MPMQAQVLAGKKLVFAPILRAGMGFIEGMLDLVPSARIAHIGLYRDPESLTAVEYYFKAPSDLSERLVIVVDPMLATGNTAVAACDRSEGMWGERTAPGVPAGISRGDREPARPSPGGAHLDRGHRPGTQRPRLHTSGSGRRRRPPVRHSIRRSGHSYLGRDVQGGRLALPSGLRRKS